MKSAEILRLTPFGPPTGKDFISQPAEKDAVKAEDAARKFEKMLPRDN
jgi:hypothetical protein